METYTFMRTLADSWVLLMMTAFFIGAIIWAFRPGSRDMHRDTANIPFRNDTIAFPETSRPHGHPGGSGKTGSNIDQEPLL